MSDDFNKDIFSSSENEAENTSVTDNASANDNTSDNNASEESSYEWNADGSTNKTSGEYSHSYVNGNNRSASHNPNNYESAYSTPRYGNYGSQSTGSYNYNGYGQNNSNSNPNSNSNSYYNNQTSSYGSTQGSYNDSVKGTEYSANQYGGYIPYNNPQAQHQKVKKVKVKKPKKPVSRGFIAGALVLTIVCSAAVGFGGGYFASNFGKSSSGGINVTKVESSGTSAKNASSHEAASSVVKKAADSVVEIRTEKIVTGSFARQYISEGAGSGVIISEDGYIVTNNHVIEGASSIKISLRDGNNSYEAELIGTDADNDIALLKVDAKGLSAALIGDSSNLAVGDYVVAIGNPLGELGGTVTDGIISALARDVVIEDNNMTLLQTNAQINPGNSGGGLFNANGELVGIVNAKQSATEIEGIGFAIPVNNAMNIVGDLKDHGYVTGKIDTGMEFVDVNSAETAWYYGVNKTGCYVLSVESGSNADKADFKMGDYINSIDGTAVATSAEIDAILDKKKVGDTVTFNITRNNKTADIKLTLEEYVPKMGNKKNEHSSQNINDDNSIWSDMFGW